MRCYVLILILPFFIPVAPVKATEVLLGTVNSVNRETGELILKTSSSIANTNDREHNEGIVIQTDPTRLPKYVVEGQMIRVWGEFTGGGSPIFSGNHIRPVNDRRRHGDPTGVRSRLGKMRKRFKHRKPPRPGH